MIEKSSDEYLRLLDEAVKFSLENLPPPQFEIIHEGDQEVLVYKHQLGSFELRFRPTETSEIYALKAGEHFTDMALRAKIGELTIGELKGAELRRDEWPGMMALWFKAFYTHLLGNNIAAAISATLRDTDLVTAAFVQATLIRPVVAIKGMARLEVAGVPEQLTRVLEQSGKEKKDLLESYLNAVAPLNFTRLGGFYEALHPIWDDIRQIAIQHKSAWREMVAAKYKSKEIAFAWTFELLFVDEIADDLFSRISGNFENLSDAEEKIIEKHDSADNASHIAIEHAARLCGAWRYQFPARTLFRKLKEQRDKAASEPPTDTAP